MRLWIYNIFEAQSKIQSSIFTKRLSTKISWPTNGVFERLLIVAFHLCEGMFFGMHFGIPVVINGSLFLEEALFQ